METENARIRLRLGSVEIEYEGKADFLKDDLPNLIERVVELYSTHGAAIPSAEAKIEPPTGSHRAKLEVNHSTNTIAAHLNANTGPELAIAAAAHLTFVGKKESFSRKEILEEMKGATTYFNTNMTSNLSKTLENLTKAKRLNLVKAGVYALGAGERSALEGKLAHIG